MCGVRERVWVLESDSLECRARTRGKQSTHSQSQAGIGSAPEGGGLPLKFCCFAYLTLVSVLFTGFKSWFNYFLAETLGELFNFREYHFPYW